jgi:hypothetical protein
MLIMLKLMMLMSIRHDATYHSSFSILRTTTWVSRVMMPVGPQ